MLNNLGYLFAHFRPSRCAEPHTDKTLGSWDPNSARWDDISVSFITPSWLASVSSPHLYFLALSAQTTSPLHTPHTRDTRGMMANMEMIPETNKASGKATKNAFTFPLNVTTVKYQSEAELKGVRVGDVIVAIHPDAVPGASWIDVSGPWPAQSNLCWRCLPACASSPSKSL